MICTEFTTADSSDMKGSPDPEIRKAVQAVIEAGLRDDDAFPVISSVEGNRLRINIKIGPVEAVFEEDLEETFEAFLDPLVRGRGEEMANLLEGLARRIREAELGRGGPDKDGPST